MEHWKLVKLNEGWRAIVEEKKWERNKKQIIKAVDLNPIILTIALNVNGLDRPFKMWC